MIIEQNFFQASDLEILSSKLEGKKTGTGYQCKCPCHDDNKNSLSLSESSAVGILYRCHAGCSQVEVSDALKKLLDRPTTNVVKLNAPSKRKAPVAIYPYYDSNGLLLFEKLRYENKSFTYRYKEGDSYLYSKPKGVTVVYYQAKLERLRGKVPVLICEGEKDCDNLNKLLGDSYVAVTNDNGATGWNKEHSSLLHGCEVIIVEDFDEAGRRRTSSISEFFPDALMGVFRFKEGEVPNKGDVSDWLLTHSKGELMEKLAHLSPPREVTIRDGKPPGSKRKEIAVYEDYVKLFEEFAPTQGRDIFTGQLMFQEGDIWKPLENRLGIIRSQVRDLDVVSEKKYSPPAVQDHFESYENKLSPKFLVNIPEWDGKNRILELCAKVKLDPEVGVSETCFLALTMEWLANVFRKLEDPSMINSPSREFILILSGKEKIGKDYWINSLLCGVGQWFNEMTITNNERDNLMQLHLGLILYLGEYDRTSKLESSFIKNIVTRPHTTLRSSHARKEERRLSRTNFIASCNPNDILRDSGQNTRYAIFELDTIDRSYKRDTQYSLQILAQAKHLANTGFVAPDDLWEEMKEYIKERTPDDINSEIAEIYETCVDSWLNGLSIHNNEKYREIMDKGWAPSSLLNDVFTEVAKKTFGSPRRVKAALTSRRYRTRDAKAKGFFLKR